MQVIKTQASARPAERREQRRRELTGMLEMLLSLFFAINQHVSLGILVFCSEAKGQHPVLT